MCHKKFLNLLVLHFLPLIVKTNPGGDETGLLQTVAAAAVCSIPAAILLLLGLLGLVCFLLLVDP